MDPTIAVQTIIISDFVDNRPVSGNYNIEALRELNRMQIRARNNDSVLFNSMRYYDMHNKRME